MFAARKGTVLAARSWVASLGQDESYYRLPWRVRDQGPMTESDLVWWTEVGRLAFAGLRYERAQDLDVDTDVVQRNNRVRATRHCRHEAIGRHPLTYHQMPPYLRKDE